jgi:hypothetical protein
MAAFPTKRLRRLRYNPLVRDMIRETELSKNDFIYPLFVVPGNKVKKPVKSMPGVFQMSIDVIVEECKEVASLGIPAVILFVEDVRKELSNTESKQPHPIPTTAREEKVSIPKLKDGKSIGEIFGEMNKLNGKTVKVRGKVMKYNPGIMGTNWIHIQDGTAFQDDFDLLVTSDTQVQLGQVITAEGKIVTNKDFGSGYAYKVLIEEAKVKVE